MRKINTQELMAVMDKIESGEITQKELAERYGVSPSAINQRIKRLKAYTPPESFMRLTDKQKAFVVAKMECKTNLAAVQSAYDVTTKESGKALATQLMQDPDVKVAINDLMAQEKIPLRRRIQRLRDMIECPDLSIAGKGLDMSFKLSGSYAAEKVEVQVDHRVLQLDLNKAIEALRKEQGLEPGEAIDIPKMKDPNIIDAED